MKTSLFVFTVYIYICATPLFGEIVSSKTSIGTQSQSIKFVHRSAPHQYKLFLQYFEKEFYPYVGYSQSPLLSFGLGSVTNFSTPDLQFNGLYSKAGLIAKSRLSTLSLGLYSIQDSLYGKIALKDHMYLSYLMETVNETDRLNTVSLGFNAGYPVADPVLKIHGGLNLSDYETVSQSNGIYYGIELPLTIGRLTNTVRVTQIQKEYSDTISGQVDYSYTSDFNKTLTLLRFNNKVNETYVVNTLTYQQGRSRHYFAYKALSESQVWVVSIGSQIRLSKYAGLNLKIQKDSERNGLTLFAIVNVLKVFNVEV